jgi:hypothetical protein
MGILLRSNSEQDELEVRLEFNEHLKKIGSEAKVGDVLLANSV